MTRTTMSIPEDVRERLRALAHERGVSLASVMREALEEKASQYQPKPRAAGIGASGEGDLAERAGDMHFEPRSWR